jgi:hypothetical protein
LSEREGIKGFARTLNAATAGGGLLGLIAGKVKTRDQILSTAAAVLFGIPILKAEGISTGIVVILAIGISCGMLIRLWKWKVGVPRSSSDY